ncbi:MAG TPA: hypothetical protein VGP87_02055 [Gemmatimonadales bacterium]|jgi:hypothetical protein|nr:hypothetical protein [Gemmatimonadales bacterium]
MNHIASIRARQAAPAALLAALMALSPLVPATLAQSNRKSARMPPPSSTFLRHLDKGGFFTVDYPDNWRTYPAGHAVSIAPEGGLAPGGGRQQLLVYGVVISHYSPYASPATRRKLSLRHHYAPFEDTTRARDVLEDITDDLVRQIVDVNPNLRVLEGSARPATIDGAPGFSVPLTGRSPVTGEGERGELVVRSLPDGHAIYVLSIAPARDYEAFQTAFARMMRTLVVNDDAVHAAARLRPLAGVAKRGTPKPE